GQQPAAPRSEMFQALASGEWKTVETMWHTNRVLYVWPRGASYGIGHFWDAETALFRRWYLNLQTPMRISPIGFDLWDYALDVVIHPDRTWSWKDEDELAEAVRTGVITLDEAKAARAEGERLTAHLDQIV